MVIDEVNHSDRTIYRHSIGSLLSASSPFATTGSTGAGAGAGAGVGAGVDSLLHAPSDDLIAKKLTQPIFATFIDTDKIEFTK